VERRFDEELSSLTAKLLLMGDSVENQLTDALRALVERNSDRANQVIANGDAVNKLDVDIDDTCLGLLALRKPQASDLRFITTVMKIAGNLERASDLAENIAERAIELNAEPQLKPYIDIPVLANRAGGMVKEALNAFAGRDTALARKVCRKDDFVDNLTEQIFRELLSFMLEDSRSISRAVRLVYIGKYYERIADHATNIAELVVYMVEGKIIRHMSSEW
jgi:phosphate transport system protein